MLLYSIEICASVGAMLVQQWNTEKALIADSSFALNYAKIPIVERRFIVTARNTLETPTPHWSLAQDPHFSHVPRHLLI
jgi:hypothetical protein